MGKEEEEAATMMDVDLQKFKNMDDKVPYISLNAVTSEPNSQPLKVEGSVDKSQILILMDYGSSHNFLSDSVAAEINCKWEETSPFQVVIANGVK